jgi:predicted AAA+ superfamily ATPase
MKSVQRPAHLARIARLFRSHPVVAILGSRQVGKSTLARTFAAQSAGPVQFFDLEDPDVVVRLDEPRLALAGLRGLVVLDEVQRRPDLFPLLRVLADRPRRPAKFLVLGSAGPDLLRQSSESLAGRIAYHELPGFSLDEVGPGRAERLWERGGFPRSFLAATGEESSDWRSSYVRTFLERDLPQLGVSFPAPTLGRLWRMLAHWHGQTWNACEIGRSFGVADTTVRRWLDALAATMVVRLLPPWHENLAKRQVKAPKVYVEDPGVLHALLGVRGTEELLSHPKCGASWEWFAIRQVVARLGVPWDACHFWGTHGGAEIDLVVMHGRHRLGFEVKRTTGPRVTPSIRTALVDLGLDRVDVIHAGDETFELAERVRAVPLSRVFEDVASLA